MLLPGCCKSVRDIVGLGFINDDNGRAYRLFRHQMAKEPRPSAIPRIIIIFIILYLSPAISMGDLLIPLMAHIAVGKNGGSLVSIPVRRFGIFGNMIPRFFCDKTAFVFWEEILLGASWRCSASHGRFWFGRLQVEVGWRLARVATRTVGSC